MTDDKVNLPIPSCDRDGGSNRHDNQSRYEKQGPIVVLKRPILDFPYAFPDILIPDKPNSSRCQPKIISNIPYDQQCNCKF